MTISSADRVAGPFAGNDVTTEFPFAFKVFVTTDLKVIHTTAAGIESTKTLTADYTVVLNADQDVSPGGTVTYPVTGAPLPTGEKLTITSDIPQLQGTELPSAGGWFPKTIENALDKLTILVQQLFTSIDRALQYPLSDDTAGSTLPTKADRAGNFLAFNAAGDPIAVAGTSGVATSVFWAGVLDDVDLVSSLTALGLDVDLATFALPADTTISAYAKTLLDDVDASAALTTLGVSAYAKTLLDDVDAVAARATLELGTANSPQFSGLNVGHATDSTLTRLSAGDIGVEGKRIFRVGGADVPVADGGTGASDAATARTNLGLGTGNSPQFTALTLSDGQIAFPAAQAASAGANTLDDYEEGTWTPGFAFGGGTTGITYAAQNGIYTKSGNVVALWAQVNLSSKGTSIGSAALTGLPFAVKTGTPSFPLNVVYNNMTSGVITSPESQATGLDTTALLRRYAAGSLTTLTDADFADSSLVLTSGVYPSD